MTLLVRRGTIRPRRRLSAAAAALLCALCSSSAPSASFAEDPDTALFRELLALHRERTAIPFILEDFVLGGDAKQARAIRARRDEAAERFRNLTAQAAARAVTPEGAGRLSAFLKPLEGMDLLAFPEVCSAAPGLTAELARIREAKSEFALRSKQAAYAAVVREELKSREPYRDLPAPRAAAAAGGDGRRGPAPYVPPTFPPQWTNAVARWGGDEIRAAGGAAAHRFLMEELISDKGRALYEKISGRAVHVPARAEIIAFIREEAARRVSAEDLAGSGVTMERLQDACVGLAQCESGVSQFFGKGVEHQGRSMEGRPVVYLRDDAISWANVVGCMQISIFWWCRSLEEGVTIAWDHRYNAHKGVSEVALHFRTFKKEGLQGDALLKKVCNRFSGGDWERMQKHLAEPQKWLR